MGFSRVSSALRLNGLGFRVSSALRLYGLGFRALGGRILRSWGFRYWGIGLWEGSFPYLSGLMGNQSLTFFIEEGLYRGYTTPKG